MSAGTIASSALEPWSRKAWSVRPSRILLFALLVFVLGNIGRVPVLDLGARQAPILINDLAVAAFVFAGIIAMGNARSVKFNDVALAALVFAALGAISAVAAIPRFGLSWFEVLASLAYLARWFLYFGIYVVIINCLNAADIERIWHRIESVFLLMAVFGIAQAFFLPDFAHKVFPETAMMEWDAQGNRLVSTILDPNVMAGLLDVILLVQLARMAFGIRVPLWKPLLLFAALVLTLSRGGLLAFAIGAAIVIVVRGPTKRMARMAAIVGLAVVAASPLLIDFAMQYSRFSVTDESALARAISWSRALTVFAESPWFGIGFNTYGFVQDHRGFERLGSNSYSADGGLLFIAVMTGLVGLGVYLFLLWCVMRRCHRGWKQMAGRPPERALFLGVGAATVAVLIQTVFVNTLLIPFMMELLWLFWGLSFVASADLKARLATV